MKLILGIGAGVGIAIVAFLLWRRFREPLQAALSPRPTLEDFVNSPGVQSALGQNPVIFLGAAPAVLPGANVGATPATRPPLPSAERFGVTLL